jgi:type III restriction enzyme, res subunit
VVDRQLQKAIMGMEHKAGLIRVMDDKCNSADLAIALNGNTKIIATTIQKFPYIVDSVAGLKKSVLRSLSMKHIPPPQVRIWQLSQSRWVQENKKASMWKI